MKAVQLIPEMIVNDLQTMIEFYSKCFDFKLVATDPEIEPYSWIQMENELCSIMMQTYDATTVEIPDMKKRLTGTDLLMLKVDSADSVKKLYERFQAIKGTVYMEIKQTEYGSCEFGVSDPEGRYIIVSG